MKDRYGKNLDAILQVYTTGKWVNVDTYYLMYVGSPATTDENKFTTIEKARSMKGTYQLLFPACDFRIVRQLYEEYE